MSRILVTGSGGYIGRYLTKRLSLEGHDVNTLTVNPARCDEEGALYIQSFSPDLLTRELDGHKFDQVFHLAAAGVHPSDREVETLKRVNIDCASALVAATYHDNIQAYIHVGSSAEYAPRKGLDPLEESAPLETEKLYGATKAEGTQLAMKTAEKLDVPFIAARLFGVYGPAEKPHRLLPSLVSRFKESQRVALSPGEQVRDWLHVDDVVSGLIALSKICQPEHVQLTNLCSGEARSVAEFCKLAAQASGADERLLGFGDLDYRPDDLMSVVGSVDNLRNLTSWRPKYDLVSGIKECVNALL